MKSLTKVPGSNLLVIVLSVIWDVISSKENKMHTCLNRSRVSALNIWGSNILSLRLHISLHRCRYILIHWLCMQVDSPNENWDRRTSLMFCSSMNDNKLELVNNWARGTLLQVTYIDLTCLPLKSECHNILFVNSQHSSHQARRHYMNQCWASFMTLYGVTGSQWVNSS